MALTKINDRSGYSVDLSNYLTGVSAADLPSGSVVQVVSTTSLRTGSGGAGEQTLSGSSSSSVEITGLSTAITPKLEGSSFLVHCNVMHGHSSTGGWMHCKFVRFVNGVSQAEVLENSWYGKDQYGGGIDPKTWFNTIDSSASYNLGDTITYKFYANTQSNSGLIINWNNNNINGSHSGVTITEIKA
jgi:hypothetical protein